MGVELCGEEHPVLCEDPGGEVPLTCGLPKGHSGDHQDVRTVAFIEMGETLIEGMNEELPKQATKHAASVAALRSAWEAYRVWQDGMTGTDDFLDWAAEEVGTY